MVVSASQAPTIQSTNFTTIQKNTIVGTTPIPDKGLKIDVILDDLAMCESGNNPTAINWFDNGSPSYGRYQFKATTLKMYAIMYNLLPDNLELVDYASWAMDGDFSRLLARKVILDGGANNWYNCLHNKDLSGI